MNSLFWKIFVWFWVAMIAMGAAIAWTTAHLAERGGAPFRARLHSAMDAYAYSAASVLEQQGTDGFKRWFRESERSGVLPVFVLDDLGRDAMDRPLPPPVRRVADDILKNEGTMLESQHRRHMVIRPAVTPSGERYYLVAALPPRRGFLFRGHPRATAWRLGIALVISGIVCFLLARHLSAPVRRLRVAAQRLAAGQFDTRVAVDLGDRRDEIGELGRDFDQMAERLQALMSAQQQLLSDVSHELRSPLARLQVALELARKRADGRAEAELDRIEREAERLTELVGQVLSLARMESADGPTAGEDVNLADLLETVAADARFEARDRNLNVSIKNTTPAVVTGNSELLHRAVENVVRNALRYTDEGTTVELALDADTQRAGWVVIRVCDHGPGVAAEALHNLFKPFVRTGTARDRDSGGYGLGLAIADRAVRLHGGTMSASNQPDQGLCVFIHLPGQTQADSRQDD